MVLQTIGDQGFVKESIVQGKKEQFLTIEGTTYEVSSFIKRHPGGSSILSYMVGQDATEAFREFHHRSRKARTILKSLPKMTEIGSQVRFDDNQVLMLADFERLRQDLVREGWFEPDRFHVVWRLIECLLFFGAGSLALWCGFNVLAILSFGLFGARAGWIQHEGGHGSLSGSLFLDKMIQKFYLGFGLAASGSMWNSMHNKHHATPQKIGHDLDLDTTPLVAFFDRAIEQNRNRKWSSLWLRFQAYTFVPLTAGLLSLIFYTGYLHPRRALREGNYFEMLSMLLCNLGRPFWISSISGMTISMAWLLHMGCMWFSYAYLFGHFSLSHTFTPTIEADEHVSWLHYALDHTVNIQPESSWVGWVMGFLNCQIEHHLFPQMPQYRQPMLSPRIQLFCKKWGLQYQSVGYWEAWGKMLGNLDDVGKHYYNMNSQHQKTNSTFDDDDDYKEE